MAGFSLLKFQIGPVQDFIAAARSTRDLWSGSYLLSWLVAAGIKAIPGREEALIFPNPDAESQPLLRDRRTWGDLDNHKALLTPNLSNLFVARVPAEQAQTIKGLVETAITNEWQKIAESVWKNHKSLGISASCRDEFFAQVSRHLSISSQITPETGKDSYAADYGTNGWHLDAVRQTREFAAWGVGKIRIGAMKDSLNGRDEAVAGGGRADGISSGMHVDIRFKHLFKHDDHLGAVALIKRVWHLTYLKDELKLKTGSREYRIRSTRAIAARLEKLDDEEERTEALQGDKYLAAIAFDGDSIGAWVNGDKLADKSNLQKHHRQFSQRLSQFALNRAREIVEGDEKGQNDGRFKGFLIYAGGDDVVALVPAEEALKTAVELRRAFREATNDIGQSEHPDASAGIAIAHFKSPLQDLIREAQAAEKRAKNHVGRPAFSVTLMKRSGEISYWGAKWNSGGVELYSAIASALWKGDLSAKFPHRVCALLAPYLTQCTGLGGPKDAVEFNAPTIINLEFTHAILRHSSPDRTAENEKCMTMLDGYLEQPESDVQTLLKSVIGLCTTVAFADRNRS